MSQKETRGRERERERDGGGVGILLGRMKYLHASTPGGIPCRLKIGSVPNPRVPLFTLAIHTGLRIRSGHHHNLNIFILLPSSLYPSLALSLSLSRSLFLSLARRLSLSPSLSLYVCACVCVCVCVFVPKAYAVWQKKEVIKPVNLGLCSGYPLGVPRVIVCVVVVGKAPPSSRLESTAKS